ncbi:UNVERIFIED_CONTAM: hypothetical protein NCL1_39723 [Trichonephila clavipes]
MLSTYLEVCLKCNEKSFEAHGLSESTEVEYNKYSKECEESINISSSDRVNFGDILTESERKIIFKLGLFKPQGPFPKDPHKTPGNVN